MRRDQVSKELAQAVFTRDRREIAAFMAALGVQSLMWKRDRLVVPLVYTVGNGSPGSDRVICPAAIIDFHGQFGLCWGRWRIEHVKKEQRTGKRAEPQMDRLMALCQGHTEDGMRAGAVWATSHRAEQRTYLERANSATSSS